MIYKTRPGIVCVRICDLDVLAATREAWSDLFVFRPLPKLWAFCWTLMAEGRNSEEAIDSFIRLFRVTEEKAYSMLGSFFDDLYKEGYLVFAEDES